MTNMRTHSLGSLRFLLFNPSPQRFTAGTPCGRSGLHRFLLFKTSQAGYGQLA
jgi:hypothetical protein